MSTSRDFGSASEPGSDERRQKKQNRFVMVGLTASVMLILAVVGVATVQYNSDADESSTSPSDGGLESTSHFRTTSAIQVICSPTDYKNSCESSLSKYVNDSSKPKDLVRAAVLAVVDGVAKAFNRSDSIKSDDPEVKAAIADCKEMHQYAVDELAKTLSHIDEHHLKQLPKQIPELKNWLSAVVAYQQTCIDGFPEGKLKSKMQAAMKSAKEITSNALAIVGKISSFLTLIQVAGFSRRLLEEEPAEPEWYVDGNPSWVSHGDRRLLQTPATAELTPNVTVAKDGSGDFTTISGALAKAPKKLLHGRYVIYVKEGVYEETVAVDKNTWNITMYGDGEQKTIVTGSKNFIDGVKTYHTATFAAIGDGFMAVDMAFLNTAGANKHQAVALRVQADRAIFLRCRMEAYQDTLYAHSHRQFYRDCLISGTIDFIFGDASAVFQHCTLTVRRPLNNQQNIVLAQGRSVLQESTGFVIQNCRIVAIPALADVKPKLRSYLGRPWQEFSNTIIMESEIGDFIEPEGYTPWEGSFALDTLSYAEYNNKGPGADTSKRVHWAGFKVISQEEASAYTAAPFIQGDDWISKMGAPVSLGLDNE
ncbi:unnamed protein product [Musa acuminata subsp. burmannicoides]